MENSFTINSETRARATRFCKLKLDALNSRAGSFPSDGWSEPPEELELAEGEVHLWQSELDITDEQCRELELELSPDEFVRARQLHFPKYQNRFVAGRTLLRHILAQYLHTDPRSLSFYYNPNGKPILVSPREGVSLQFNLSHSDGVIVLAVARNVLVGIDVERVRPMQDADRIAALLFSRREYAQLCALRDAERDVAFFNAWTRKEACLKAIGQGLDESISEIEVTLIPGEPARILGLPANDTHLPHWSLASFRPAPGYIAALAALVPPAESAAIPNNRRLTTLDEATRNRLKMSRRFCWANWAPSARQG